MGRSNNTVASIIWFVGALDIAGGAFLWLIMLCTEAPGAWTWLIAGAISGLMFIGFAEIINLLQEIIDKQSKIIMMLGSNEASPSSPDFSDLPEL